MLMLLAITVFLLVPVLIVYGANVPVEADDEIIFGVVADNNPDNAVTLDSIMMGGQLIETPNNPQPMNTISLSGVVYYEGVYYHGGTTPSTYTPPTAIGNLLGFVLPLALILAVAGFSVALARNRSYRLMEGFCYT